MARLKEKYLNEVVPGLQEQFKYTNVMAIPNFGETPLKSRTRGRATLSSLSTNSYIRSPRKVTFTPTGIPSLNLKPATFAS